VRPANPDEIAALDLPSRGTVIVIIRTSLGACDVPIDTADIVIPSDRCELIYDLPTSDYRS